MIAAAAKAGSGEGRVRGSWRKVWVGRKVGDREVGKGRTMGVGGVINITINGKLQVSGA